MEEYQCCCLLELLKFRLEFCFLLGYPFFFALHLGHAVLLSVGCCSGLCWLFGFCVGCWLLDVGCSLPFIPKEFMTFGILNAILLFGLLLFVE